MRLTWESPKPSFENVIPEGEGWYLYYDSKWRRIDYATTSAKWITGHTLVKFARQALKELKK